MTSDSGFSKTECDVDAECSELWSFMVILVS